MGRVSQRFIDGVGMSDLDDVLSKAQRLADRLIDECIKIRPGDIGGKLFARAIAEYVLDVAAKKHEAQLVDDGFIG